MSHRNSVPDEAKTQVGISNQEANMKTIKLTTDYYRALREDYAGFCTSCGSEAYGVEPDACEYECEGCGNPTVYGIEECLLLGMVTVGGAA